MAESRDSRRALAAACCALGVLLRDQHTAEHMQVASQDSQCQVTLEARLTAVAAAFQSIARLQGTDR